MSTPPPLCRSATKGQSDHLVMPKVQIKVSRTLDFRPLPHCSTQFGDLKTAVGNEGRLLVLAQGVEP
jgi:hypothetical protein